MKVLKKAFSVLLVLLFLLGVFPTGLVPTAGAMTAYADLGGHWAAATINRWNNLGFIDSAIFRGNNFWPNRNITRAEFFSLIVYSMGAFAMDKASSFSDVYINTWQYEIVAIANQMGIAAGYPDGTMRPNDTLLRQDAATLAARAMGMSSVADWTLSRFYDASFISDYARPYVAALVEQNIMSGYPNGTFGPRAFLTRAEAVKLLDNLFANIYMPETGFRNVYLQGGMLIQSPGAELRDVIIDGDVIVGDGVGDGNVVIANSTINGRLIVRGGGPNSVTVSNTVVSKGIYVASFGVNTHVAVTDNSTVPILESVSSFNLSGSGVAALTILENATKNAVVNLDGVSLDELNINGPGAQVTMNSGHAMYANFNDAGQNAKLELAANTSVGHLTVSAPGAIVTGAGSIRNLMINNSGAIVAQTPEFLTLGLNILANVGGVAVSGTESQWLNNNVDRVSPDSDLKVQLLTNVSGGAPFDQTPLHLTMVAGGTSSEVHVFQAAANRVPLTQRNDRWGYWVGFFVPAPPEAANMASVTYTYVDGEPIALPPRTLDTYNGKRGMLIFLPVFREPGREAGVLKEVLYINWGGHLTENINFISSTMYLASLNNTQKTTLQNDFDNMIMYSIQGGALQYTGAEAVRRILASDNPLGISSTVNRGLDAINRAVSSSEARGILEDSQFAADLTVDSGGNTQYSALSNAGKQYVAEQVLAARKTIFANPAAVKAAFDKAVQARLAAETALLGQINSSGDYSALRKIIEATANAAVLQFQTGANPYYSYTNARKNDMATYLWDLRQYKTLQDVIDAIQKYLGDPANGSSGDPGSVDIRDLLIRRITATVTGSTTAAVTFAYGNTRDITVAVELTDGSMLRPEHVAQLITDGVITLQWTSAQVGDLRGPVGSLTRRVVSGVPSNIYTVECVSQGTTAQNRADTLTFTLTDSTNKKFTAAIRFTVTPAVAATDILRILPEEVNMYVGGSPAQLDAVLAPANSTETPRWSSRNPDIARVDELTGLVTAVAKGVTTVVARIANGKTAERQVRVFQDANDIIVDPDNVILTPGGFRTVTFYTATPGRDVIWKSNDPRLAVSQSGNTVTITADRNIDPSELPIVLDELAVVGTVVGTTPSAPYYSGRATVSVEIRQDTGVTMGIRGGIPVMYSGEQKYLELNVQDEAMFSQQFYINVAQIEPTGATSRAVRFLGGDSPVRPGQDIIIEASETGIGLVRIRLTTTPGGGDHVAELYVVVAPKSPSDVTFRHTGTTGTWYPGITAAGTGMRTAAGNITYDETYGRILAMQLSDRPTVTASTPVDGSLTGMSWSPYTSNQYREILYNVRTNGSGELRDSNNNPIYNPGITIPTPLTFNDVFVGDGGPFGTGTVGGLYAGYEFHDPTPATEVWRLGFFKYDISDSIRMAVLRGAGLRRVTTSILTSTNGVIIPNNTVPTGLAAVVMSPPRNAMSPEMFDIWGDLYYMGNEVQADLFVGGQFNPRISPQSGFKLWVYSGGVWNEAVYPYIRPSTLVPINSIYDVTEADIATGNYRVTYINGEPAFGTVNAIMQGDPNFDANTFYIRLLPDPINRPLSPLVDSWTWQMPVGAPITSDTHRIYDILIQPGSRDLFDSYSPSEITLSRTLDPPYLQANFAPGGDTSIGSMVINQLDSTSSYIYFRTPYAETRPTLDRVYTYNYSVSQVSKYGFAPLPHITGDRQIPVESTTYSPQSPTPLQYILTMHVPPAVIIPEVTLWEGDLPSSLITLDGVGAALNAAGIAFSASTTTFNSDNTGVISVSAIGGYTVVGPGTARITIRESGTVRVAYVDIEVKAAYEVEREPSTRNPYVLATNPVIAAAADAAGIVRNANIVFSVQTLAGAALTGVTATGSGMTYAVTFTATATLGLANIVFYNTATPALTETVRIRVVNSGAAINPMSIELPPDFFGGFMATDAAQDETAAAGAVAGGAAGDPADPADPAAPAMPISPIGASGAFAMENPAEETDESPPSFSSTPPPAPAITELKLRTTAGVAVGKTTRLEPYVTPYNADKKGLVWTSSNTDVATVANGIVTGIKAGTAKISVTDADGKFKAECTVTVRTDPRAVTSIVMNKKTVTLNVGATNTLAVTYKPTSPTIKGVTWVSDNSAVARVEPNGKVIAVSAGTATITAISDSGGKTATCLVTVKVPVTSVTLAERTVTLHVGETYQIDPTVNPSDATVTTATYSTSSTSVASVSSTGLVTARKVGSATITVKVDGKAVTLRVTVARN